MNNKQGKIIAIVGAPSVGKSTLARHLRDNYQVKAFFEGEENNFPEFIKENIAQNKNRLQTTLFFHNQNIDHYNQALLLKSQNHHVVLDTFWLTNLFFINDDIYQSKAEQELVRDMVRLANQSFTLPDYVVYMEASDQLVRERSLGRDRGFEADILDNFIKVNQAHVDYFDKHADSELKDVEIIRLQADNYDKDDIAQQLGLKMI